jgi:hypothetical protein
MPPHLHPAPSPLLVPCFTISAVEAPRADRAHPSHPLRAFCTTARRAKSTKTREIHLFSGSLILTQLPREKAVKEMGLEDTVQVVDCEDLVGYCAGKAGKMGE